MKSINDRFKGALKDFSMIQQDDTIIVAVSGGSDSMCLLYLLNSIKEEQGINIIVAHVNHNLRGRESDLDEQLVKSICDKLKIECVSISVDIKQKAKEIKKGIEETARDIRYEFFDDLSKKYNAKIATAHNLSDNAETMLFNIIRGTSINGLQGIKAKRDNIIRPLIYISKNEIKEFCKERNIKYRDDISNDDILYTRNKIRHLIVPIAKEINPNFENSVYRLSKSAALQEIYMQKQCEHAKQISQLSHNSYSIDKLKDLDRVIFNRLIAESMQENLDTKKIDLIFDLVQHKQGAVEIKNNLRARVANNQLIISEEQAADRLYQDFKMNFRFGNISTPWGDKFTIKLLNNSKEIKNHKKWFKNLLNYDTIKKSTAVRVRIKGDKFITRGNTITKSYKKIMQENNIDKSERNKLLVIANDNELLWIDKIGTSNTAVCNKATKRAVVILKQGEDI